MKRTSQNVWWASHVACLHLQSEQLHFLFTRSPRSSPCWMPPRFSPWCLPVPLRMPSRMASRMHPRMFSTMHPRMHPRLIMPSRVLLIASPDDSIFFHDFFSMILLHESHSLVLRVLLHPPSLKATAVTTHALPISLLYISCVGLALGSSEYATVLNVRPCCERKSAASAAIWRHPDTSLLAVSYHLPQSCTNLLPALEQSTLSPSNGIRLPQSW